jgi:hypothetical protein
VHVPPELLSQPLHVNTPPGKNDVAVTVTGVAAT